MSHLDLRPIHKVVNGEVKKVPILVDCSVKGGGGQTRLALLLVLVKDKDKMPETL